MGSVKDLQVIQKPTMAAMGIGRFLFSDRYSVFDWGEMPDHIDGKGAALCLMGAYCFEQLELLGVKTHYRGLVNAEGTVVKVSNLKEPTNIMEVALVNIYKPKIDVVDGRVLHDYHTYSSSLKNYLIPLEIIYRNGLPEGSSVFKLLAQNKVTLADLGLDHQPKPGETLTKPLFGVSTKLEEIDRYITWTEAQKIAGLTELELDRIKTVLLKADQIITDIAANTGLKNEDGKIELAFDDQRDLMIVDVLGTLDECRFSYDGVHVSKEVARQFYKTTPWCNDLEQAKKDAEAQGVPNWKSLCRSQPPKLDPKLKTIISQMYMAAANEMTGYHLFSSPKLTRVIEAYKEYMGEKT
ncbi:MAG: phosphoribosylaminoimidazolesuccinocarboxamide synthase [Nitrososphaerota archaeon]|jgi:phosphoribosylaminoimidazole-succinocarboxamide synthase|nr:phosphoribosylaminoimidazolesuccinocarboxamide synthase [Nitrososphaerota archaeon]